MTLDISNILLADIEKFFLDPDNFNKFISIQANKEIAIELQKHRVPVHQRAHLRTEMQKIFIPKIKNEFRNGLRYVINNLSVNMPTIAKEGQLKGISKSVIPQHRVEEYRRLSWRLICSEKCLLLGDFGVLIEIESQKKFTTFYTKDFKIKNIFLPISRNHLIVGSKSNNDKFLEFSQLNILIAEHSREYFISSENNAEPYSYIELIGKKSQIFTEEEIIDYCDQIFKL